MHLVFTSQNLVIMVTFMWHQTCTAGTSLPLAVNFRRHFPLTPKTAYPQASPQKRKTGINIFIYSSTFTLLSKMTYSNSYTHSCTDGGCHERCRPADQEQFGVQYLAQGRFRRPGELNQRPSDNSTLAFPIDEFSNLMINVMNTGYKKVLFASLFK